MAVMNDVTATRSPSPPATAAEDTDAEKLRFIEEVTSNMDGMQERMLAEILGRNAETEYLRKCGLSGATDRATFWAKVPMVTYEDLKPFIRRIADGDRSPILSAQPVSVFFCSSGTSAGECKLIPSVDGDLNRRQWLLYLVTPVMNLYVPGLDKGKDLYFLFVRQEMKTLGGLPVQAILTSYYKSDHFKNRPFDAYNSYTSPTAAVLCKDAFRSMYAHTICGLCQHHDVLLVGTVFASTLIRADGYL